jgi:DNA-binding CsgD family transcriptional regulator
MRLLLLLFLLCSVFNVQAQYRFSGYVDTNEGSPTIYLSVVEDYRKLTGVYNEQIIAKTSPDSIGFFVLSGNLLDERHRIYKIHTDNCNDAADGNHFNGQCGDSKEVLFIAKNNDTINFPYGFEKQVFCDIESNNPRSMALIQIDSLKEEMKFAYSEYRSEANRKLNNKKWFKTLQEFSEATGDPLAELYAYAFLSDRRNELHSHYVEDLKTNPYYKDLLARLESSYPNSSYTRQYRRELQADRFMLGEDKVNTANSWLLILYVVLALSLFLNGIFLYRQFQQKKHSSNALRSQLSKQEQVVLDLLLEEKTNKEIAERLFLSVSTVKTHTNSIYKKLKVQSREEAKSLFIR